MGVRGGADQADTSKPFIATDPQTSGPYDTQEMGVTKLATGAAGTAALVSAANGLPVALDAASLAALETIGLDAATLAALETISVATFPADYPDAATLAKVEAVRVLLSVFSKAEDAVHASGDVGIMALAVRNDAQSALAGTDGDYIPLNTDSVGALRSAPRKAGTATLTNVNDGASSATLLAAAAGRVGVILHNDSPSILYVKYGATASATSYTVKVAPDQLWEMPQPIYTGVIDGIWSADASGAARITELT